VEGDGNPFCFDLFEAIMANPLIEELCIQLDESWCTLGAGGRYRSLDVADLRALGRLIETTQSLQILRIPIIPGDDSTANALMVNQTLQQLHLTLTAGVSYEPGLIICSITSHPTITTLEINTRNVPVPDGQTPVHDAICSVLASTRVLQSLTIDLPFDKDAAEYFVAALHANQSLTQLNLENGFDRGLKQYLWHTCKHRMALVQTVSLPYALLARPLAGTTGKD
jgi:hypothetical protein